MYNATLLRNGIKISSNISIICPRRLSIIFIRPVTELFLGIRFNCIWHTAKPSKGSRLWRQSAWIIF